ncbi:protein of unknown function [Bradyrhizobium vignae]|jgi:hypothetical protein|uniref:Uncharacterized protein n=1 Tax=Bradyrhizobium vignae TaxID=1549949 RepID=A0A2U3PQY8_9BRAD|nr:protein of unknown function [Bradyrhizobium vignae]
MPRLDRGIQYAAASRFSSLSLSLEYWIAPGDDSEYVANSEYVTES